MNTTMISPPSALAIMASRCNVDPAKLHSTLKNTVFKGATDDEMLALVVTANAYELNPILKELYAFPKKGGGITPMVGVDGWLKIANRQPNYDGMSVEVYGEGKTPTHATCEIFLKDRSHSVKITEYYDECKRATDPWTQMPKRMLRNKAMIQAIRVAFGISGIQDEDEARDIAGMRDVTPVKPAPVAQILPANPFKRPLPEPEIVPEPEPEPVEETPDAGDEEARIEAMRVLKEAIKDCDITEATFWPRAKKGGYIPMSILPNDLTSSQLTYLSMNAQDIADGKKAEVAG